MKKHKVVSTAKTALLLHFDGSLTDAVNNKSNISGSISSYPIAKFGQGAYFNRNTISYDTSEIDFSGDWTVDFWWQDKSDTDYSNDNIGFFSNSSYFYPGWDKSGLGLRWIRSETYNQDFFRVYFNTTLYNSTEKYLDWSVSNAYFKDKLHHIAMVKSGTTGYFFVDGILKGTKTGLPANDAICDNLKLGDWTLGSSANGFNVGIFDEFRISRVARWTSNFTPPTQPYVID